jgi:large subunit ribosomal protein L33
MSQDKLIKISAKGGGTYVTTKNKKTTQKKLELRKYSKKLRKHVIFKEVKK